ncbi:hypothetical protein HYH03_009773 [Edaphochlamys debaryana]|uniref:N-acetyltransferase domain-containing protein n=1 Tax=Edaphochlamys debaryana TaxID=47281 RepID=A0A835XYD3_9CHLO|nr:hypothetical protein HYH03_009773 [Edaphochlamys debaryana]|eukprot:KAG2492044.1 hypothetical protein HYH03_009773 [Edaphochlamys debaryana]
MRRRKGCSFATTTAPTELVPGAGTSCACASDAAATSCSGAGPSSSQLSWALQPQARTGGGAPSAWLAAWREGRRRSRQGSAWGSASGDGGSVGCSRGGGGGGRALLLASLTTSAAGAGAAAGAGPGLAGDASLQGLRRGFNLPQLSIMSLPGSPAFVQQQGVAQELYEYHLAKHGAFPRPCLKCGSAEFFTRGTASAAASSRAGGGGSSAAQASPTTTPGSASTAGPPGREVVAWASRPLRCETCGCWLHLGCAGVDLAERAPPPPFFHSRACREAFLRLEASACRNPHTSCASPAHRLFLITPAAAAAAVLGPVGPGLGPLGAGGGPARGPAGAVVPLLAQGFNADAIRGFGQPAREYDGGKYAAVLSYGGEPVAAATLNVWGGDAQLCMLATARQHRLKGYARALVEDVETALAGLGVRRLLVQARGPALPLWLDGRLGSGYSLMDPGAAAALHGALPVAYYDCALLEKELGALAGGQGAAGVRSGGVGAEGVVALASKPANKGSTSGPTGGGSVGLPGGHKRGRNDRLTLETRKMVTRELVKRFQKALDDDIYPGPEYGCVFGVDMGSRGAVGGRPLREWPLGQLTLGAWKTIRNWYLHERTQEAECDEGSSMDDLHWAVERAEAEWETELERQLLEGSLRSWYEGQLRRLEAEGHPSGYSHEILRRGCGAIPWDRVMHDRLAGRA